MIKKYVIYQFILGIVAVTFLSYLFNLPGFVPVVEGQFEWKNILLTAFLLGLAFSSVLSIAVYLFEARFIMAPNDKHDLVTPTKVGIIGGITVGAVFVSAGFGILPLWVGLIVVIVVSGLSLFI